MMSLISPKPVIANVITAVKVSPGMTFSLIEDVERRAWIMESCPVGTQFWTVDQAAELPQGARTGPALREIISAARAHIDSQSVDPMRQWADDARSTPGTAAPSQLRRQKTRAEHMSLDDKALVRA